MIVIPAKRSYADFRNFLCNVYSVLLYFIYKCIQNRLARQLKVYVLFSCVLAHSDYSIVALPPAWALLTRKLIDHNCSKRSFLTKHAAAGVRFISDRPKIRSQRRSFDICLCSKAHSETRACLCGTMAPRSRLPREVPGVLMCI